MAETFEAGDDGWTEWHHPEPGFVMYCCDCGLAHRVEFVIADTMPDARLNPGETHDSAIIWRLRRADELTGDPSSTVADLPPPSEIEALRGEVADLRDEIARLRADVFPLGAA